MELMLRPVQDLLVGTSTSMGTRGLTIGIMMMLTICIDLIIINITEAMMRTTNLTMAMMLKFNSSPGTHCFQRFWRFHTTQSIYSRPI